MYWTCEHCGWSNEEKYDLCWLCEVAGCTKDDHKCCEEDFCARCLKLDADCKCYSEDEPA
jgi:hypothetical protein